MADAGEKGVWPNVKTDFERELPFEASALIQLARIADELSRLNRILMLTLDIDPDVKPESESESELKPEPALLPKGRRVERDPHEPWTDEEEEAAAAIELLEQEGYEVPPDAYKRLGLEPPVRADEPTEDELTSLQPGADQEIEGEGV